MKRPQVRIVLSSCVLSMALGTSVVAMGQDGEGARGRAEASAPETGDSGDGGDDGEGSADASESSEGGEKVKVFRFTGLDISGRLKSPQLLYFLNRLRAEFDRPRLPHRSFMPELERSTKSKAF